MGGGRVRGWGGVGEKNDYPCIISSGVLNAADVMSRGMLWALACQLVICSANQCLPARGVCGDSANTSLERHYM